MIDEEVVACHASLVLSDWFSQDVMLNDNIKELDLGTRARNRAFQDRLDEIWGSTAVFDKKLQKEAQDAMETILNMKDDYQRHINNFSSSLLAEVHGIFDKFDNDRLPAEALRLDAVDADLEIFFKQIVPSTIEKQSGEVSRQLRRAYETFDIEKKKEEKRSARLCTLLNAYTHHCNLSGRVRW